MLQFTARRYVTQQRHRPSGGTLRRYGVGGPTVDLCPHSTWLTPRVEDSRDGGGTAFGHTQAPYGTNIYGVFAPSRPNAVPLAVWRPRRGASVAFTQPMAAGFTSLRHAGFHRWFHLWQPAPTIGHTSTEQLSGANDGTGSARRSAHHQERTCHARKEGLRSAILRLPRRDENAQRLCSPLAPRRAILVCRRTRLGACDWRPDADVQRGVASL